MKKNILLFQGLLSSRCSIVCGKTTSTTTTSTPTSTSTSATCRTRTTTTSSSTSDGGRLGSYLVVEGVESLSQGAVHVEPPVADEVLLVEQRAIGAEEAVSTDNIG